MNQFSRTEMMIGKESLEKLQKAKVAVFGLGGVGGYAFEALVRAGIGQIAVVDGDQFSETNLNRQILATWKTIGQSKVDVAEKRAKEICPNIKIEKYEMFFLPENAATLDFSGFDYILDAVDTVAAKLCLVEKANEAGVPIISCMGTGNKLDPTRFKVSDIYETSVCPLAKVMRHELRKRGIKHLKVVWSDEEPMVPIEGISDEKTTKRSIPASISFVPSVAGLVMASEVIKDISSKEGLL